MSDTEHIVFLTGSIVSAYVSNNTVEWGELSKLIDGVHKALSQSTDQASAPAAPLLIPAVDVRQSVFPDYIVCLEDGEKFKSLRRHLSARYGLSPDEYRAKWGLAADYPMVAPNYSAARSALARTLGLGHIRKLPVDAPIEPAREEMKAAKPPVAAKSPATVRKPKREAAQ